jgi:broad specificity phosphatase PhoE
MQVILVRHGETEYNAQGRGYAPVSLSTRGRQQAMLVGPRVQSLRPTVLYSRDILHAHENATLLSQHVGLPVQLCTGLRAWTVGNRVDRMVASHRERLRAYFLLSGGAVGNRQAQCYRTSYLAGVAQGEAQGTEGRQACRSTS